MPCSTYLSTGKTQQDLYKEHLLNLVCRNSQPINEIVNCRIPFKLNPKLFPLHILMLCFLWIFLEAILLVNIFFSQTQLQNMNCVILWICYATVIPERESTPLSINYDLDYLLASQEAARVVHMGYCCPFQLPMLLFSTAHPGFFSGWYKMPRKIAGSMATGEIRMPCALAAPFIQGSPKSFIKI